MAQLMLSTHSAKGKTEPLTTVGWRPTRKGKTIKETFMIPFKINIQSVNLEVAAKITDSMVQDYGCRVTFDKDTGQVDLIGGAYCKDVVEAVVIDRMQSQFVAM